MRRRILAVAAAAALMLLAVPQSASAVKPRYGCGPGFDLGALTVEQGLALPNTQAAFADGVYDEAWFMERFEFVDNNDDGLICYQNFPPNANPASLLQYFYNVVDNNASVPSS